jgi:hypothetical protein
MKDKEKANCHICVHEDICQLRTFSYCEEEVKEKGCEHYQPKLPEDSVVYKGGKIYYNGEHIGYIEFSFYEDIKALGFGNFEIIDKRKGYGTLVIKDIIHKYKDKYNLIYCFVDKNNIGAVEFYKKVGKVCFDITNDKGQYQVILYGKEDSVVLLREELNTIQANFFDSGIKCGSNQTAKEFLDMIYWKAVKYIKGKNKDECFIEMSFEKLDELAKQFGVEIKE